MNQFKCPLCGKVSKIHSGDVTNSGGYTLPYASCECGFSYKPVVVIDAHVGEGGWAFIDRKIEKARELIVLKLPI